MYKNSSNERTTYKNRSDISIPDEMTVDSLFENNWPRKVIFFRMRTEQHENKSVYARSTMKIRLVS